MNKITIVGLGEGLNDLQVKGLARVRSRADALPHHNLLP